MAASGIKLRARADVLATTLFAVLGAGPLGCGGSAVADRPQPGSGGSAAGGSPSAGGTAPNPHPCESPIATEGGFEQCADGTKRRLMQGTCSSRVPRPEPIENYDPAVDTCQYDSDCVAAAYGHCKLISESIGGGGFRACSYGCVTDADCGLGAICFCGDGPIGECQPASCTTAADCAPGFDCRSYEEPPYCSGQRFACQEPDDGCVTDADCVGSAGGPTCTHFGASRLCANVICTVGRPFLVRGEARAAPGRDRDDWLADSVKPAAEGLSPALRRRLAEAWLRAGQMEHASIAAFARFTLQLLSLGAPADLVEAASRALADETRHARLCFALASGYQGRAAGPGPLSIDGSLEQATLLDIVVLTIREGCIGETVAALEAAEAAEHASDPVVAALLRGISADETRHAELAWRFVRWAMATSGPELCDAVAAEFSRLTREPVPQPQPDASQHELLLQGVLPEAVRVAVRIQVLTQVVDPCARALCAGGPQRPDLPGDPRLELT